MAYKESLILYCHRKVVLRVRPQSAKASTCEVGEFPAPREQQHIAVADNKYVNVHAKLSTEFGIIINMGVVLKTQKIKIEGIVRSSSVESKK